MNNGNLDLPWIEQLAVDVSGAYEQLSVETDLPAEVLDRMHKLDPNANYYRDENPDVSLEVVAIRRGMDAALLGAHIAQSIHEQAGDSVRLTPNDLTRVVELQPKISGICALLAIRTCVQRGYLVVDYEQDTIALPSK